MLRLLLTLSSLALLSIAANRHDQYHGGHGMPVHVPKDYHHPPNHGNGGRWRRGLAAATDEASDESVDREDKKDWRGHKGHHEFLTDLSEDARKAYFSIKMDDDLSRDEKREKILDWAQENGVEEEIAAHFAAKDREIKERKAAMADAIEDLPEAYEKASVSEMAMVAVTEDLPEASEKVSAIFDDSSLSRKEQMERMEEMMKEYSEELKSLLRAAHPCGGRHDHRQKKWRGSNGGSRRHGQRRSFADEEEIEF